MEHAGETPNASGDDVGTGSASPDDAAGRQVPARRRPSPRPRLAARASVPGPEASPDGEWREPIYPETDSIYDTAIPVVSEPPIPTFKRVLYSLWFYIIVMVAACLPVWAIAGHANNSVANGIAMGVTLLAIINCGLRAFRGSVLTARRQARDELIALRDPSDRLREQLWPGELVQWESRQHPIAIVPTVFTRLTATRLRKALTLGYLVFLWVSLTNHKGMAVAALSVGVGAVAMTVVEWGRIRYAITTQRLLAVEGLFSTQVPFMPRARMTDVKVITPWIANVFAWLRWVNLPWGTWDVESAGQDQALKYIYYLPAAVLVAAVFSIGKVPTEEDGT